MVTMMQTKPKHKKKPSRKADINRLKAMTLRNRVLAKKLRHFSKASTVFERGVVVITEDDLKSVNY